MGSTVVDLSCRLVGLENSLSWLGIMMSLPRVGICLIRSIDCCWVLSLEKDFLDGRLGSPMRSSGSHQVIPSN